ncbi:MAG: zinc ribbon domain-containing protein [Clostridia bacterium]|nr:zinc ribbon domain-containing protein [Clostridia bacterium]
MALINCPECGKQVSSVAKVCPDCGFPIASSSPIGIVKVKIGEGLLGKVKIWDVNKSEVIWTGRTGDIAEIEVNEQLLISFSWGIGKMQKDLNVLVKPREKYEMKMVKTFMAVKPVVRKIDIIDGD